MMRSPVAVLALVMVICGGPSWAEQRFVEHVIIPAERGGEFVLGHYGTAMGPHWTPIEAQVRALEAGLPAYLARAAPAASRLRQGLAGYRAQYIGIVRDGRQVVFANWFCDALGTDWRQRPVIVDDGGDCFFQVEYDPSGGTYVHLMINGNG